MSCAETVSKIVKASLKCVSEEGFIYKGGVVTHDNLTQEHVAVMALYTNSISLASTEKRVFPVDIISGDTIVLKPFNDDFDVRSAAFFCSEAWAQALKSEKSRLDTLILKTKEFVSMTPPGQPVDDVLLSQTVLVRGGVENICQLAQAINKVEPAPAPRNRLEV